VTDDGFSGNENPKPYMNGRMNKIFLASSMDLPTARMHHYYSQIAAAVLLLRLPL